MSTEDLYSLMHEVRSQHLKQDGGGVPTVWDAEKIQLEATMPIFECSAGDQVRNPAEGIEELFALGQGGSAADSGAQFLAKARRENLPDSSQE